VDAVALSADERDAVMRAKAYLIRDMRQPLSLSALSSYAGL